MSTHVLLNFLNELGKRYKMRDLSSILSLFRNEFNKFNNTRARMLDYIYHMTDNFKISFLAQKVIILVIMYVALRCYGRQWFIFFITWRYFIPKRKVIIKIK